MSNVFGPWSWIVTATFVHSPVAWSITFLLIVVEAVAQRRVRGRLHRNHLDAPCSNRWPSLLRTFAESRCWRSHGQFEIALIEKGRTPTVGHTRPGYRGGDLTCTDSLGLPAPSWLSKARPSPWATSRLPSSGCREGTLSRKRWRRICPIPSSERTASPGILWLAWRAAQGTKKCFPPAQETALSTASLNCSLIGIRVGFAVQRRVWIKENADPVPCPIFLQIFLQLFSLAFFFRVSRAFLILMCPRLLTGSAHCACLP